jgi:membrane protease YdiL (CAAX protease family)
VTCTIIVAPVIEEWLFRGVLQQVLRPIFGSVLAIALQALVFAVAHGNFAQFLQLLLAGALLGVLFQVSGSLAVAAAVHALLNVAALYL